MEAQEKCERLLHTILRPHLIIPWSPKSSASPILNRPLSPLLLLLLLLSIVSKQDQEQEQEQEVDLDLRLFSEENSRFNEFRFLGAAKVMSSPNFSVLSTSQIRPAFGTCLIHWEKVEFS